MTRPRHLLTGALAALFAAGAGPPADGAGPADTMVAAGGLGQAEVVVRNESFSTLAIAVVDADRRETNIGQAPPEFTNTLYISAGNVPTRVRFRARLRGSNEILYESDAVDVLEGARVRWTLPDNVLELVRPRAGAEPEGVATPSAIG